MHSELQHLPIEMREIDWLLARKDPRNPRVCSDGAMARLVGVIGKHGFVGVVTYNEQLDLLVGGHQSLEAAAALGYTHLPTVTGRWNEQDHYALNAALNAEYGVWERDMLRAEMLALQTQHYDLDYTGLPPWQLEDLFADPGPLASARAGEEDDGDGEGMRDEKTHTCPNCGHSFADEPSD
jgi:hypothetical protein